jgi:3-oxoacyl-[acyl-carrier protein] reductase
MSKQIKVAVVTGASRGIGAAIARRLSQDGFAVVVGYAEDDHGARALLEELERNGRSAVAIGADVSVAAAFRQVFDVAEVTYGGVDVPVNNAGIMDLAPIAETLDGSFDRQVAINLRVRSTVCARARSACATAVAS